MDFATLIITCEAITSILKSLKDLKDKEKDIVRIEKTGRGLEMRPSYYDEGDKGEIIVEIKLDEKNNSLERIRNEIIHYPEVKGIDIIAPYKYLGRKEVKGKDQTGLR